jgi:hypothetical protein
VSPRPGNRAGDSTPWYASFWEFCARYCSERFDDDWHLSPEQSLRLLAEDAVVPRQVVVYSPKGANHNLDLPFGTSLYDLKVAALPEPADLTLRAGVRVFAPHAALVKVPESFVRREAIHTRIVLAGLRDASDILRCLLGGGNSAKAGLIAGALRSIGRPDLADEIARTMKSAGYRWTVIRAEDRDSYLAALDGASIDGNIAPFTMFVSERVQGSVDRGTTRSFRPKPRGRHPSRPAGNADPARTGLHGSEPHGPPRRPRRVRNRLPSGHRREGAAPSRP